MKSGLAEIALAAGTRVIADLHLDPLLSVPWRSFETWLEGLPETPALLVLGDLFEYWTGPGQARDPDYARLFELLRARARAGCALHFLHGNRDFLLGRGFAEVVGGQVHPAGLLGRTPEGRRVLFLHGDELATRDRSYQRLRRVLRSGPLRAVAAAAPAFASAAVARRLRRRSRQAVARKDSRTVELQLPAVRAWCERTGASELVCGHAHAFRCQDLGEGRRWWVLDAFGGRRDVLRLGPADFVVESSGDAGLQAAGASLSSRPAMIIALDGPAGVGKSTLARRLARELGLFFLDTGAMYRAVTLAALRAGIAPADEEACARVARGLALDFDEHGEVLLDGAPGEPAIRGQDVNQAVSRVAAHPAVREVVVARQRLLAARHGGTVAEGRDTTTVVFPDATHKFFLTASAEERARRRARQENALERLEEIHRAIEQRDAQDSSRAHSPLRPAPDAVRIETDGLGPDEVLERLLATIRADGSSPSEGQR